MSGAKNCEQEEVIVEIWLFKLASDKQPRANAREARKTRTDAKL